ncbi:MAG: Ig-like domain-containing protein [Prevotellaceae bacterium]|nr:Ig-like domain-containing protein [Prevotellaceae bacterium]
MKTQIFKWAIIIVALFCAVNASAQAPDVEMGYGMPNAWANTTINNGSAKEFSTNASKGYTSQNFCGVTGNNAGLLDDGSAYFEGSLTANSASSSISKIIVNGSTNQGSAQDGAIAFSDKCPFDANSVIGIQEFGADIRANACANAEITPPVGTKSFRLFRRTYYAAGSPGSISQSSGGGRTQYGNNQTIYLGNLSVWISLPGPIIDGFTLIPGYDGVITTTNLGTISTIVVDKVPYATDITNVVPEDISLITGTSFAAGSDDTTPHDFSSVVSYEVTDGSDNRTYEVTVNKIPASKGNEIKITKFTVPFKGNNLIGTVDNTADTIGVTVPFTITDAELAVLAPVYETDGLLCRTFMNAWTPGCDSTLMKNKNNDPDPLTHTSYNFSQSLPAENNTNPVIYTIVAENGEQRDYVVKISRAPADIKCNIDSFYFTGYNKECYRGVISGTKIMVTLPASVALDPLNPVVRTNSIATTPIALPYPTNYTNPVNIIVSSEKAEAGLDATAIKEYEVTVVNHTHKPDTIAGGTRPANGATGLGLSGMAVFTFDEDITATGTGTVTITGAGSPSLGAVSVTGDETRFTYSNLESEEEYTITIPAGYVEDCWGNTNDEIVIKFTTGAGVLTDFPYAACMNSDEFSTPAFIQGSTVAAAYNAAADTKATTPNQYGAYEIPAGQSLIITVAEVGQITASIYAPGSNRSFTITTGSAAGAVVTSGNFSNYENKGISLTSTAINASTSTEIYINNTSGSGVIYVPFIYISANGQSAMPANDACCK